MTSIWLKDRNTGLSGLYPAEFATLFETLEPVNSNDAICVDCLVFEDVPNDEDEDR